MKSLIKLTLLFTIMTFLGSSCANHSSGCYSFDHSKKKKLPKVSKKKFKKRSIDDRVITFTQARLEFYKIS